MPLTHRFLSSIGALRREAERLHHANPGSLRARLRDGYFLALVDLAVLGVAVVTGSGSPAPLRTGLAAMVAAIFAASVIRLWPLL